MSIERAIATAPERIWLCVSDDIEDYRRPFPTDLSEVTWAKDHAPVCCAVKYLRSDTAQSHWYEAELTALRAQVAAMREALEEIRSLQSCVNSRCSQQYPCDACKTYDIAEAALATPPRRRRRKNEQRTKLDDDCDHAAA